MNILKVSTFRAQFVFISDCPSQFFTWIALGDAALHISLILVRKASAVDEETRRTTWLYRQCNQSIHMTDGVMVESLSCSLLQKKSAATYRLCQMSSYLRLVHKFEKWCNLSSCVKAKSRKNKSCKMRPVDICRSRCDGVHIKTLQQWLLLMSDELHLYVMFLFCVKFSVVWFKKLCSYELADEYDGVKG